MKHYTYKTINTNNKSDNNKSNFSKILDNIILSDIINQNSFLKKNKQKKNIIKFTDTPKYTMDIFEALGILSNYSKKNETKIDKGILQYINNIPVIFYDDEIQIGFDIYSYDDLDNINFINSLTPKAKEDIIKISIKINI